jgi:phosphoglycolate phosphatase
MNLVIFDCDGTLIDSQNAIVAAMQRAFAAEGLAAPSRAAVLGVVGLSLPEAFARLAPCYTPSVRARLAGAYKSTFSLARADPAQHEPLFPGAEQAIAALASRDDIVLGIATGKSRRGVARMLDRFGWRPHFATIQTADDNPSKPHPAMIERAMAEAGIGPEATVMVGDTAFDMAMAVNAGVVGVGVAWGYHSIAEIAEAGAHAIVDDYGELLPAIDATLARQREHT